MTRDITIAAFLGVKDEVELIEPSIRHLKAIGVDHIVVCDMSSTDGTREILERFVGEDLSVFSLTSAAHDTRTDEAERWTSHARNRYAIVPCDWVIFLDADEFWLPATGNLKDCAAFYSADVLIVERYNVVLGSDGPCFPSELTPQNYDQIALYARAVPNFHIAKQTHAQSVPWIRGMCEPKTAARRSKIVDLAPGQHDVIVDTECRRERPDDLVVAHLGLSTLSRFERKVANIREIYADANVDLSQPDESWQRHGTAWHWRRWATTSDLAAEFNDNAVDAEMFGALRENGEVMSAQALLDLRAPRLGDAYRCRKMLCVEIEYEWMFRPRDVNPETGDTRLVAITYTKFRFSCAESGAEIDQFDFLTEPARWYELFGLSGFEPHGRWSSGPRTSLVFPLPVATPEKTRIEISHQVAHPKIPARIRVNGGAWNSVVFEGDVLVLDVPLSGEPLTRASQNISLAVDGKPTLSIVLISHDQPELTFASILAIQAAHISIPYEIIVVDNGSSTLQAERLAEIALPVRLIATQNRVSFGTANNLATEIARGEFILLLNNDAFLSEGVVERLQQELLTDDSVGLVGPVFRFPDDSLQEIGGFIAANGLNISALSNGLNWDVPDTADVDYVSAACVMLRRVDFLGISGFDPEFEFAYSEDVDLCLRLRATGKCARVVTSVSVIHIRGATSSRLPNRDWLEAVKRRNVDVLRARLRYLTTRGNETTNTDGFDVARLEQQIAHFPVHANLHGVHWDGTLSSSSGSSSMLAHASALGCLQPTMVLGATAHAVLDVCSQARALGLVAENLTAGGRAELERRTFDVMLVSTMVFPPMTTPSNGARRILHCQEPTIPEGADLDALRQRLGNLLNFDAIVVDSEFSRRACLSLLENLDAPSVDIEVIGGPVDVFSAEERSGVKENIIVCMGPLQSGPAGGAQEAALRAFRAFSTAQHGQRWRLVIVGTLPVKESGNYIDHLRHFAPELDVDVMVCPPRAVLRRLLARAKIYLSAFGYGSWVNGNMAGVAHCTTQLGTAISAGCVPVVFHMGAEAEFLAAHDTGHVFGSMSELNAGLLAAARAADSGGLPDDVCEKMADMSQAAHHAAWARLLERLPLCEKRHESKMPALIVTGCDDTGLTAMARLLSLGGADLADTTNVAIHGNWEASRITELNKTTLASHDAREDDPSIFFERHRFMQKANEIGRACRLIDVHYPGNRPILLKDARICMLAGPWDMALRASQYQPKYVIIVRNPNEVAGELSQRYGCSIGKGLLLWASYMLAIERDTRSADRVFIAYEDLISHPKKILDRVSAALDIDLIHRADVEVNAQINRPDDHHPLPASILGMQYPEAVSQYYEALLAASLGKTPRAAGRGKELDHASGEALEAWLKNFITLFQPEPLASRHELPLA